MIKKLLLTTTISTALLASTMTLAGDTKALKDKLVSVFKEAPTSLKESPIPGVYEAAYGMDVIYVSADGKYFLAGDLYDLTTRKNLTETTLSAARKKSMDAYDKRKTITFKAESEKHVISVFTDIDCPYCAKIHQEVPELNKAGVTVRYFMFPRAGVGSNSYKKAVSVWCNDDQNAALTKAKNREQIEEKTCDNPVKEQYQLGREIGITGTPAIVLDSGELIPGYRPAKNLVSLLNARKKMDK